MLEEKLDEIAGSMAEIAECLKVMLASEIFTNLPAPKKATRRDKRKDKIEEMLFRTFCLKFRKPKAQNW
jgi:hypothetical protein